MVLKKPLVKPKPLSPQAVSLLSCLRLAPDGLSSYELEVTFGMSNRKTRQMVAAVQLELAQAAKPIILGWCPLTNSFKIAENKEEAHSIWWNRAGRSYKLIRQQAKIKAAIKRLYNMTDQDPLFEMVDFDADA